METLIIKEPIWNGGNRCVGIRVDRLAKDLKLEITTIDSYGNRIYPHSFLISKQRASLYPIKSYSWGDAYIIPIEDL